MMWDLSGDFPANDTRSIVNVVQQQMQAQVPFRFKENDKVSYKIVADWVISEYKSQGAIQENGIHKTDMEVYRYYDLNDSKGISKVQKLFDDLAKIGFAAPIK